jgi:hypothetical protein
MKSERTLTAYLVAAFFFTICNVNSSASVLPNLAAGVGNTMLKRQFFPRDYTKFPAKLRDEFSIKVTSLVCATLRLTVDYAIAYIADTGCQIRQH